MLRRKQPDQPAGESQPNLPSSVRFALKHREAMLNPSDIGRLFGNRLGHMGFYMAMKASSGNDAVQADLLERASSYGFDLSRVTRADAAGALEHLAAQEPPHVEGQKLDPVYALGVHEWKKRFPGALKPVLSARPEASLFMVANAPYIGLDELAALSLHRGHSLGILKPDRFGQTDEPVGFMLEPNPSGTAISPLPHNFERPGEAVLFDDVIFTGTARDRVMEFWGQAESPDFVASFVDVSAI